MKDKPVKYSKKKMIALISLAIAILLMAIAITICGAKNIDIATLRKRNYK